jgi:DNA repair exonuclease SbcCD ATPase subunit
MEFKETIGVPYKEIVDEMVESYKKIKELEKEKGMSMEEMRAFVEEHSDLILNLKELRRQAKALKKDVESLNRQRNWLSKEVGLLRDLKNAHERGFQQGFNTAMLRFGIHYYCAICNQPIWIEAGSEVHRAIIELLRERGWGHTYCHQIAMQYR